MENDIEIKTLQEVVEQAKFRPENDGAMKWAMGIAADVKPAEQKPPCIDVEGDPRRKALLTAVVTTMDSLKLDALIYPTWSNPPRKIDDSESPDGNNSPVIAPHSGQPAITVPMGYVDNNLPLGLQYWADRLAKKNYFNMPMPMNKPPNIENRLYCSRSRSQSLIVSVGFGSEIAADKRILSACSGEIITDRCC